MTFEIFLADVGATMLTPSAEPWDSTGGRAEGLGELTAALAGVTVYEGAYRIHTRESAAVADSWIDSFFPLHAGRFRCFSETWAGIQFAIDLHSTDTEDLQVSIIEPASASVFLAGSLQSLHEVSLQSIREEALALPLLSSWRDMGGAMPDLAKRRCLGFKQPLFLGGESVAQNLEEVDMDVYWQLCSELKVGVLGAG